MIAAKKFGASGTIIASRRIIDAEYEAQHNKGTRRALRSIAKKQAQIDALKGRDNTKPKVSAEVKAERREEYKRNCIAANDRRIKNLAKVLPSLRAPEYTAKELPESRAIVLNGPAATRGDVRRFEAKWVPIKSVGEAPLLPARFPNFAEFEAKRLTDREEKFAQLQASLSKK